MQILSIHLKNIKSHRDREIAFTPGINVLSGPNGVGKSTIFEAIGYALFGVDARDFVSNVDRFLTIGTKRGEIAVTFVAENGGTYRATRTVGTPANWRLAGENGGDFEIEDHANMEETEARIRELLGLSAGRSLADQFKLVIGPFQNDFLGPFVLKQQTKRKEAFDEILGIDSWRKTFDGTKEMGNAVKATIATLQAEIAGKEERVASLPERQSELAAQTAEQAAKHKELEEKTRDLASTAALLQQMEGQKKIIDSLVNEVAQVEQSIVSGGDHLAAQKILVDQGEAAARTAAEAKPGKERFQVAEQRLVQLREREKSKQALEREMGELVSREASALQSAEHEEKEAAAQEKNLTEVLLTLKDQDEALQSATLRLLEREKQQLLALDQHRELESAFRGLPVHQLHTVIPYLKGSLRRLVEIDGQVHGKKALLLAEEEWKEKAEAMERLRKERELIQAEKATLEGKRFGILEGEEKLAEGLCPFFQDLCRNLEGKASLEVFTEKKRHLEAQIGLQTTAMTALDEMVVQAEAAGREMEKFRLLRNEIETLMRERGEREKERLDHLQLLDGPSVAGTFGQWADKYRLEQCRNEGEKLVAADYSGAPSDQLVALEQWEQGCHAVVEAVGLMVGKLLTDVEEPLTAIGAEKAKLTTMAEEVEKRRHESSSAGQRITERKKVAGIHRQAAAAAAKEKEEKARSLTTFNDVEGAIREWEEVKSQTQRDHERYLQAEPTALELPKRQEILGKYVKRLAELEKERVNNQQKLGELNAAYSSETHIQTQIRKESLHGTEAALRESLRNIEQNLKRIGKEIIELEKVRDEIRKKQDEVKALRKKEELVKLLRNKVFKHVSAQLSERFREEISLRADSIYRTIAEADEELLWGENYQIVLRDLIDGNIRERSDDQLSGGQVMSAVVALRLALLQTIGARIAFFDEPTSNLDASRRENLAQAFRAIDHGKEEVTEHWYDQLFLISHDISFTEITDQVIDLSMESR